jgi:hypothetical protein
MKKEYFSKYLVSVREQMRNYIKTIFSISHNSLYGRRFYEE